MYCGDASRPYVDDLTKAHISAVKLAKQYMESLVSDCYSNLHDINNGNTSWAPAERLDSVV
jgi:hypothetical protein